MQIKGMSVERYQQLRELAKLMNGQNAIPYPITTPLLECFDLVISPTEAELLLRMGPEQMPYERCAALSGMAPDELSELFETMLNKGLLLVNREGPERTYAVAPFMQGWFERQLGTKATTPYQREFARRIDRLFLSWKRMNFFPLRQLTNLFFRHRTRPFQSIALAEPPPGSKKKIAVNRSIPVPPSEIVPTSSVQELIERHGDANAIALIHCFCRQWREIVDEPCRFKLPTESCVVLGNEALTAVEHGIGRPISKAEALEIISEVQKRGAIHVIYHERDEADRPEIAICNCCWDCCGALGSYNRGAIPLHYKCFYVARVSSPTACKGCKKCEKHCPVAAVRVENKRSSIEASLCIGCGQCAFQCDQDVIALDYEEREVFLPLQKLSEVRIG